MAAYCTHGNRVDSPLNRCVTCETRMGAEHAVIEAAKALVLKMESGVSASTEPLRATVRALEEVEGE